MRRSEERERCARGNQDRWQTFPPGNDGEPLAQGFGSLALFGEDRLPPGASLREEPTLDVEIVTYVREGAIAYRDSSGRSGVVNAGEFQRWNAGRRLRRSESNASRTDPARVFRMFLRPSQADGGPSQEQRRFSVAERRGGLRVIAASDGRSGALRIHSDAVVCSALLELGKHVVHELAPARCAWVHIVEGIVTLGELVLTAGDGAGISAEHAVSLTAREDTELLLLDLSVAAPLEAWGVGTAQGSARGEVTAADQAELVSDSRLARRPVSSPPGPFYFASDDTRAAIGAERTSRSGRASRFWATAGQRGSAYDGK